MVLMVNEMLWMVIWIMIAVYIFFRLSLIIFLIKDC